MVNVPEMIVIIWSVNCAGKFSFIWACCHQVYNCKSPALIYCLSWVWGLTGVACAVNRPYSVYQDCSKSYSTGMDKIWLVNKKFGREDHVYPQQMLKKQTLQVMMYYEFPNHQNSQADLLAAIDYLMMQTCRSYAKLSKVEFQPG